MGTVKERLDTFHSALKTLEEIVGESPSVVTRDATIQRFEYTTEAAWKALKHFLLDHEGIECNTPKGCARQAFKARLINEEETEMFLRMVNDRNLTSHTYVQEVAQRIASVIPDYAVLLRNIFNKMYEEIE